MAASSPWRIEARNGCRISDSSSLRKLSSVVTLLRGRETGLVDAVVHLVVDPLVQRVDFGEQVAWRVVARLRTDAVEGGVEHPDDLG